MTYLPRRVYEYGDEEAAMTDEARTDEDVKPPVERAALGVILAACPRCGSFDPFAMNHGGFVCVDCGRRFTEAAYYQRVAPPAPSAPSAPEGLTRDEIETVLAPRRPSPPDAT
jgi:DNA-directed RNA polymerase subunit RPC12/RpoP